MDDIRSLEDLAAAAAQGDRGDFEALVHRSHGFLMSQVLLVGVEESDRDDVAQEACLRMYRRLERYDSAQPFLPWYRTLIRHVAIDHLRRAGGEIERRKTLRIQLLQSQPKTQAHPLDLLLSTSGEAVRGCVDKLPAAHRRLVHLRYLEDRSPAEIAEIQAAKAGAIRTALSRIRSVLRSCLEENHSRGVDYAARG